MKYQRLHKYFNKAISITELMGILEHTFWQGGGRSAYKKKKEKQIWGQRGHGDGGQR